MAIGATTPESRTLADLRYYEAGSTGLGYNRLSGSSNVAHPAFADNEFYTKLAEKHFERANLDWWYCKDAISAAFEMQSSWYYLILAASCGEI